MAAPKSHPRKWVMPPGWTLTSGVDGLRWRFGDGPVTVTIQNFRGEVRFMFKIAKVRGKTGYLPTTRWNRLKTLEDRVHALEKMFVRKGTVA